MTDTRELIERYRRWLSNTGFDGGVNSPPVLVLDALTAALEREEVLRKRQMKLSGYACHDDNCDALIFGIDCPPGECSCGLRAALSENSQ